MRNSSSDVSQSRRQAFTYHHSEILQPYDFLHGVATVSPWSTHRSIQHRLLIRSHTHPAFHRSQHKLEKRQILGHGVSLMEQGNQILPGRDLSIASYRERVATRGKIRQNSRQSLPCWLHGFLVSSLFQPPPHTLAFAERYHASPRTKKRKAIGGTAM